jgi:hypothetical protein
VGNTGVVQLEPPALVLEATKVLLVLLGDVVPDEVVPVVSFLTLQSEERRHCPVRDVPVLEELRRDGVGIPLPQPEGEDAEAVIGPFLGVDGAFLAGSGSSPVSRDSVASALLAPATAPVFSVFSAAFSAANPGKAIATNVKIVTMYFMAFLLQRPR